MTHTFRRCYSSFTDPVCIIRLVRLSVCVWIQIENDLLFRIIKIKFLQLELFLSHSGKLIQAYFISVFIIIVVSLKGFIILPEDPESICVFKFTFISDSELCFPLLVCTGHTGASDITAFVEDKSGKKSDKN